MMNRIMNGIVANVTGHQTGPDCRRALSEKKEEQHVKDNRQGNADYRRHHQPFRIIWIIVVNAVDDEVEFFSDRRCWLVMKDLAMDNVFKQRPNQHPDKKQRDNQQDW